MKWFSKIFQSILFFFFKPLLKLFLIKVMKDEKYVSTCEPIKTYPHDLNTPEGRIALGENLARPMINNLFHTGYSDLGRRLSMVDELPQGAYNSRYRNQLNQTVTSIQSNLQNLNAQINIDGFYNNPAATATSSTSLNYYIDHTYLSRNVQPDFNDPIEDEESVQIEYLIKLQEIKEEKFKEEKRKEMGNSIATLQLED